MNPLRTNPLRTWGYPRSQFPYFPPIALKNPRVGSKILNRFLSNGSNGSAVVQCGIEWFWYVLIPTSDRSVRHVQWMHVKNKCWLLFNLFHQACVQRNDMMMMSPPKKRGKIDIDHCWLLTMNHAVESIPNLTSWAMNLMISIKWVKQWSIAKRGQLARSTRCKSGSKVFISNLEPVIGCDTALHSWALLNTPVKNLGEHLD